MKSQQQSTPTSPFQNHPLINKDSYPLPEANTKRWVASKKAQVIIAVRAGALSFEDACEKYSLSAEEFYSWFHHFDEKGLNGLCVTKLNK